MCWGDENIILLSITCHHIREEMVCSQEDFITKSNFIRTRLNWLWVCCQQVRPFACRHWRKNTFDQSQQRGGVPSFHWLLRLANQRREAQKLKLKLLNDQTPFTLSGEHIVSLWLRLRHHTPRGYFFFRFLCVFWTDQEIYHTVFSKKDISEWKWSSTWRFFLFFFLNSATVCLDDNALCNLVKSWLPTKQTQFPFLTPTLPSIDFFFFTEINVGGKEHLCCLHTAVVSTQTKGNEKQEQTGCLCVYVCACLCDWFLIVVAGWGRWVTGLYTVEWALHLM